MASSVQYPNSGLMATLKLRGFACLCGYEGLVLGLREQDCGLLSGELKRYRCWYCSNPEHGGCECQKGPSRRPWRGVLSRESDGN